MGFTENLRAFREAAGISAKDFARQIGVPYTTYANYENVGSEPKYATLIKIASALHVSIDDLLGFKTGETNRNITICKEMGLFINTDEEDGKITNIAIFDEDKNCIGIMPPEFFNDYVPYLYESAALSAKNYFQVLAIMTASDYSSLETMLKNRGVEVSPSAIIGINRLVRAKIRKGELGNLFTPERNEKIDSIVADYLKENYPQELKKAKGKAPAE